MVQEAQHCEARINDLRFVEHLHHTYQSVFQAVAVQDLTRLVAVNVTG